MGQGIWLDSDKLDVDDSVAEVLRHGTLSVGFIDETAAKAQVKGTDAEHDIAVISVNLSDLSADTLSQIKVIQVGSSADLQVGEQVVTSHISSTYLQGLFIGYISEINVDSNNLTRSGYITPAVDFSNLQEVLVITTTKEDLTQTDEAENGGE